MFTPILEQVGLQLQNHSFQTSVSVVEMAGERLHNSCNFRGIKWFNELTTFAQYVTCKYPVVLVVCLDHQMHHSHHCLGIRVSQFFQKIGGKTIVIQHAGNANANLDALATTASRYLYVWNAYAERYLRENCKIEPDRLLISGNPCWDPLIPGIKSQMVTHILGAAQGRPIILLATMMHGDYGSYKEVSIQYHQYLEIVRATCRLLGAYLVIKPHPSDEIQRYYLSGQSNGSDWCIIDQDFSSESMKLLFTEIIALISRNSTMIEDALMLSKAHVISFDLPGNESMHNYRHHMGDPRYSRICTLEPEQLQHHINSRLESREVQDNSCCNMTETHINFSQPSASQIICTELFKLLS